MGKHKLTRHKWAKGELEVDVCVRVVKDRK